MEEGKKQKNCFLIILLFCMCLVFYLGIKDGVYQFQKEYANRKTNMVNIYFQNQEKKFLHIYEIPIFMKSMNQKDTVSNKVQWHAVERKENYNNELQYYSKDNAVINSNNIVITSRKETKEGKEYTSGLVESKYSYKYGNFKFSIEIAEGKGLFPAIWLLPDNGYSLPEIDIFEMIGSDPYLFYGVIHFKESGVQKSDYFKHKVINKNQYSISLQWNKEKLAWYIDDEEIYTTAQGVPQEHMYVIINQAIGGNWAGVPDDKTIFPNQFRVFDMEIESESMKWRRGE